MDTDNVARGALFIKAMRETGDDDAAAAQTVFKSHPRYGDPQDTTDASGEDRPLPIVLKDRVNRYAISRAGDLAVFKRELQASTSFNAHVRGKLGIGP